MSGNKTCKDCTWYDDGRELCFMLNGLDVVHPAPHSTECFAGALVHGQSDEIAQLKQQLADEQELTVAAYMSGAASQRDKIRELAESEIERLKKEVEGLRNSDVMTLVFIIQDFYRANKKGIKPPRRATDGAEKYMAMHLSPLRCNKQDLKGKSK